MNFSSLRFDWEADASKSHLMSTSQDLHRFSSTEQQQFAPADWASVVEPFQQRRSIDSNGDVQLFADKWLSQGLANPEPRNLRTSISASVQNPFADSFKLLRKPSMPLSTQTTDNIFRAVIKLSLIANQRLKYGLYKMRTGGGTSKVKPKSLLGLPEDLNFKQGYRSSGFTFGTKSPFSLTPSEVTVKKENSIVVRQVQSVTRKLKTFVMRQAFNRLKLFKKDKKYAVDRDSMQLVKLDSVMSLPRRPKACLNFEQLIVQNVKLPGEERLMVPGKQERNSRLTPIIEITPDEKNMQENGEQTDHSTILPQPLNEALPQTQKPSTVQKPRELQPQVHIMKQPVPQIIRTPRMCVQDIPQPRPLSQNPSLRLRPGTVTTEYIHTTEKFIQFPAQTDRRRSPPSKDYSTARQTYTLEEVLERINRCNQQKIVFTGAFSPQLSYQRLPSPSRKSVHENNNFVIGHQLPTLQQTRSPLNVPIGYARAVSPKTAVSPRVMSPGGGHRFMPQPQHNRLPSPHAQRNQYGLLCQKQASNYRPFQKPMPFRLH